MVNANGGAMLELHIVDKGTLRKATGCSVLQISLDGIYFDRGTPPRLGRTMLVPSAKADWLVVCNTPGIHEVIRGGLKIFNFCMVWFHMKITYPVLNANLICFSSKNVLQRAFTETSLYDKRYLQ